MFCESVSPPPPKITHRLPASSCPLVFCPHQFSDHPTQLVGKMERRAPPKHVGHSVLACRSVLVLRETNNQTKASVRCCTRPLSHAEAFENKPWWQRRHQAALY